MMKIINWYNDRNYEGYENESYVGLCLEDIRESARALEEMRRIKQVNPDMNGVDGWLDYHKDIFFEQILLLFDKFGFEIDELIEYNEEGQIIN